LPAVWPPERHRDDARVQDLEAVEESGDPRLVAQGHRHGGDVVDGGGLDGRFRPEVAGRVRDDQVAARGQGVAEGRDDLTGFFGVGDEVQDRGQQQRRRLAEIDQLPDAGVSQDAVRAAQVG
jgi:hypothetical protein